MASKKKTKKVESNINKDQLKLMQEQQRLADEARQREQALIAQQTAQQEAQYNQMLSVYQEQINTLQSAREEQDSYLKELTEAQEKQAQQVAAAQQRQEAVTQQAQNVNVSRANRQYSLMNERRAQTQSRRSGVFNTNTLPAGYSVTRGIMR